MYMMKKDGPQIEPGQLSSWTPYMMLYLSDTENEESPQQDASTIWELVLYSENMEDVGEYEFKVVVELANYPTSTPAVAKFSVTVEPCLI